MKVSSHYVGMKLKPHQATVSSRASMNYAAAVGDNNPAYFNDLGDRGTVAHPMQALAVTWPILGRLGDSIEAADFPREILTTQVHYTEHLQLHRLIIPGDKLKISGELVAILPHPAGTHMVTRLDASDAADKPVFTEFIGGLMRGVECTDRGRGGENLPQSYQQQPAESALLWDAAIAIHPLQAFVYDGCTNIHFPIHTSKRFAKAVGLPEPIFQGSATLALAVREMINRESAGNPERVKSIACRFTGMVVPGSDIRVQLQSRAHDESGNCHLSFQVLNEQGGKAISRGHIELAGEN